MRLCPKCQQHRQLSEFGIDAKRKDGLQSWCRECNRVAARALYRKKTDVYKANSRKHRSKLRDELRVTLARIKEKYGCFFCKEKEQCVLEFHHMDQRKDAGGRAVSHSVTRGRGAFIKEVNKCVVLCANCHKKVHARLLHVSREMLCNEPVIYKKRIFEHGVKTARCTLKRMNDDSWLVKFLKPHSVLDRFLVLKTDIEKAEFATSSIKKIRPVGWDGEIGLLPIDWQETTLKNLRRCHNKYYGMATVVNERDDGKIYA